MDSLVPLPASVLNERYDLLGWNEAYAALWPGVIGAQPGERNVLWQNFTQPDCCHPYVSRHDQAGPAGRPVPGQLRAAHRRARVDQPDPPPPGSQPALRPAVGRARRGEPGHLPQDLPAPGVPAAGHDEHQPRRAGRALHPDGGLHARGRRVPGRDRQAAGRRGRRRPVPLRARARPAPRYDGMYPRDDEGRGGDRARSPARRRCPAPAWSCPPRAGPARITRSPARSSAARRRPRSRICPSVAIRMIVGTQHGSFGKFITCRRPDRFSGPGPDAGCDLVGDAAERLAPFLRGGLAVVARAEQHHLIARRGRSSPKSTTS